MAKVGKYSVKQINSMILHCKINHVAEIQYISQVNPDKPGSGDLLLYDFMSANHLTEKQLIAISKDSGWEEINE